MSKVDICPISGDQHRYFIWQTKNEFEPFNGGDPNTGAQLFVKIEYAILGCNCGSAIKKRIKQS